MDIEHWHEYRNAKTQTEQRQILGRILVDNEKFIVRNVERLMRRGLVSSRSSLAEVPKEDLIQAGRLGYLRALEKFDPSKGAFPTYAQHWIRHEVQQAAIGETTIRKPKDSGLPYATLRKREEIRVRTGRDATAEELGLTEEAYSRWRTEATVRGYFEHYGDRDLAQDVGEEADGGTAATENWLEDHEAMDPEQLLALKDMHASVDRLPEQERNVIRALFFSEKSTPQILNELGMSCSTLYGLRDSALARLREEV